jgi:nitroreductase
MKAVFRVLLGRFERWAAGSRFARLICAIRHWCELDRELTGIFSGAIEYQSTVRGAGELPYKVRRQIHRLEKGLTIPNRRQVFAEDYVEGVLQNFIDCVLTTAESEQHWPAEYRWAFDILTEYFETVPATDRTREAHNQYLGEWAKIRRLLNVRSDTSAAVNAAPIDERLTQFYERRSCRSFEGRPVPEELIRRVLIAAQQSPTACNKQPYRVYFSNEQQAASRMLELAPGARTMKQNVHNVLAVVGDYGAYEKFKDRNTLFVDSGIFAMAIMLAFRQYGIESCPINWQDVCDQHRKIGLRLGLKSSERVVLLIAFGYPLPKTVYPKSTKKLMEALLVRYE